MAKRGDAEPAVVRHIALSAGADSGDRPLYFHSVFSRRACRLSATDHEGVQSKSILCQVSMPSFYKKITSGHRGKIMIINLGIFLSIWAASCMVGTYLSVKEPSNER